MDLQESLSQYLKEYAYGSTIAVEIINAVKILRSFDIKRSEHVFTDGKAEQLLTINGTIPIHRPEFRKIHRYVPITLYLQKNFPLSPPICFVSPEENQELLMTDAVDSNCQVYFSYLKDWRWPGCDLRSLFEIMIAEFSFEIPLIFLDKEDESITSVKSYETYRDRDTSRSLYESLANKSKEAFTCGICQHVIKPPAILATCCGQIIGCDACVKEMEASNWDKRCPLCRREAPALKPINGLNEFIDGMNDIP